jgi:hypothetical protein
MITATGFNFLGTVVAAGPEAANLFGEGVLVGVGALFAEVLLPAPCGAAGLFDGAFRSASLVVSLVLRGDSLDLAAAGLFLPSSTPCITLLPDADGSVRGAVALAAGIGDFDFGLAGAGVLLVCGFRAIILSTYSCGDRDVAHHPSASGAGF